MNSKLITVVIPVYNREKLILRAAYSVLNQTYKNIELIIVDDGSTDNTKQVIKTINDSRIKYVYQNNSGACAARNYGIDIASGDYIAFQDSDDFWYPEKLEKQIKKIEAINADIVFCKLNLEKEKTHLPTNICEGFINAETNIFGIGTQTILGKREVIKALKFDEQMPRLQEFEMLLRALEKYKIYCMDEALVDYNLSGNSISKDDEKLFKAFELIEHKDKLALSKNTSISYQISNTLIWHAIKKQEKNDEDYKRLLGIAKKYNMSLKARIKIFLIERGKFGQTQKIFKQRIE